MKRISRLLCIFLSVASLVLALPDQSTAQFKPKGVFAKDSAVHQFDGVRWFRFDQLRIDSLTTTNNSYQTIATITVASNEIGTIDVGMLGINDSLSAGITGQQIARYVVANGTLTLTTPSATLTTTVDSDISVATWDITTSANQIIVRVKGKTDYRIRWVADIRRRKLIKRS